jgi:tetratricopeptide (TPR) repeat protein
VLFAAAERLYREAVSIADEFLDGDHPDRAIFRKNLATALLAQGRATEAEPLAREALAIFRSSSPTSWRVADAESVLGACIMKSGRFQEAEPLLLGSYRTLKEEQGGGAKYAAKALERIVELYIRWGRPAQAAEYRSLLLKVQ